MQQFGVLSLIVLIFFGVTPGAESTESTAGAGSPQQARSVLQPVLMTSAVMVGQTQVAFGLLRNQRTFVTNADVVVRLYARDAQPPTLRTEVRAFYHAFDIDERITRAALSDGMAPVEMEGMYVAQVLFDRPGLWVFEVLIVQDDGPPEVSRSTIEVLVALPTPTLGTAAQLP